MPHQGGLYRRYINGMVTEERRSVEKNKSKGVFVTKCGHSTMKIVSEKEKKKQATVNQELGRAWSTSKKTQYNVKHLITGLFSTSEGAWRFLKNSEKCDFIRSFGGGGICCWIHRKSDELWEVKENMSNLKLCVSVCLESVKISHELCSIGRRMKTEERNRTYSNHITRKLRTNLKLLVIAHILN